MMNKMIAITLIFLFFRVTAAIADVNIGGISAPDPLEKSNGTKVSTTADWENTRRGELLNLFTQNIYGTSLPKPTAQTFSVASADFAGVRRKTVTITVSGPSGTKSFPLRLFIPTGTAQKPSVFLLIDHRGTSTDDPAQNDEFFPVAQILSRGFAVAAFHAGDLAPDDATAYRNGVINLFYPASAPLPANAGKTLSAWSWGASRSMDYLMTDADINAAHIYVVGHSRGGKAALWTGAQDTRFAGVISNDSGSTGAKLARHVSGETIRMITTAYPHWFCSNYRNFNDRETALPIDQHELVALMAPRRVYIASAATDAHSDPQGEFFGHLGAMPVYQLYRVGTTGLSAANWRPTLDQAFLGEGMGYHIRSGNHGLLLSDWNHYMDFAGQREVTTQRAYSGAPFALPGLLQAENYDLGGEGVAYHDTTLSNEGRSDYRPGDAVDIQVTKDVGGGNQLAYLRVGEWYEYTTSLPAGKYNINVRMSSPYEGRRLRVLLGSDSATTVFTPLGDAATPANSSYAKWTTVTIPNITINPAQAGSSRVLRLQVLDDEFNLNWVEFVRIP
jgi:hypothetical protein